MLKRLLIALFITVVGSAFAQPTVAEFKELRKKFAITRTDDVKVLDKFVGAKVLEIIGLVKGTFSTPEASGVLLEFGKDDTVALECPEIPEWVFMRELEARAIVRAERAEPLSGLRCVLIAIAPVELVPDLAAAAPKTAAAKGSKSTSAAKKPTTRASKPLTSRGGIGRTSTPRNWSMGRSEVLPYYVDFVRRQNRNLSEREATRIADNIIGYCLAYGVDARLIMAIVMVESGFDPNAVSVKGAGGLGQLMPGTAGDLGVRNRFNIEENVYGMVRLMRKHLETYIKQTGDANKGLQLALAAYNAGPGAVKKYGGIPPYSQTVNYVKKVSQIYKALTGE